MIEVSLYTSEAVAVQLQLSLILVVLGITRLMMIQYGFLEN